MAALPDLELAHRHCTDNRAEIERSDRCGRFFCGTVYEPIEITEWVDMPEPNGTTARCPYCSIDAVIGAASGLSLTMTFLTAMRIYWFGS